MIFTDVTKTNMHKLMNFDKLESEIATLRAENERLRDALKGMLENVISNQAQRGQIAVMNARAALYAKEALK